MLIEKRKKNYVQMDQIWTSLSVVLCPGLMHGFIQMRDGVTIVSPRGEVRDGVSV